MDFDYTKKSWQEIFQPELSQIENQEVLKILDNVFNKILPQHKLLPASSSGKYHPLSDLGAGGLIRHSKVVFQIVVELIRATPVLESESEEIMAAALIHDLCKYPDPNNYENSSFTHPVDMAELIRKENFRNFRAGTIARLVQSHMGIWNKMEKYYPGVELPVPNEFDELIVHYADLIASRRWIDFKFDDNGNLIV